MLGIAKVFLTAHGVGHRVAFTVVQVFWEMVGQRGGRQAKK